MTDEEKLQIVQRAACNFHGQFADLERAVGMLMLGDAYGWRVLTLAHERRTLRKYEEILGITVREAFDERGPLATKSIGLKITDQLGNFWKVVKGEASRKDASTIGDSLQ
ncbi:MAG: hypothetical protein ABF296_12725 [Oceanococcaceae bacterium]